MAQNILIHGLGQTSSSWDKTISHMKKENDYFYPDLWVLLNGKEATYANLYQSFKDYCDDFSDLLNLCGLSLGAMLAMNYAMEYPKKVHSLVLIGAQYKMPKGLLKVQNIAFRLMPSISFIKMGMQKKDVISLTSSMLDLDFSANLKDISCAVLVLCGEKDAANKKAANYIAEAVPKANLQYVEHAGHEVNIDVPNQLAEILDVFLA